MRRLITVPIATSDDGKRCALPRVDGEKCPHLDMVSGSANCSAHHDDMGYFVGLERDDKRRPIRCAACVGGEGEGNG